MDHAHREYGLVMPFVVVASKDGPYDDDAYTAGYEMGLLDARLETLRAVGGSESADTQLIHADNLPQADLIAMRHDFTVTVVHETENWREISVSSSRDTPKGRTT